MPRILTGSISDVTTKRLGSEGQVSGEVFSAMLTEKGYELSRDFVGAGFPVIPNGIASSDGGGAPVYGTVGLRTMWMSR